MAAGFETRYRTVPTAAAPVTLDEVYEACRERFPKPRYTLRRDEAALTVWVCREDEGRSVGLQASFAERVGLERALQSIAKKLGD